MILERTVSRSEPTTIQLAVPLKLSSSFITYIQTFNQSQETPVCCLFHPVHSLLGV